MFFEIVFFIFLGILTGMITGLIPGLHPNTVFVLMLSLTFLLVGFHVYVILSFIVSLAVSNTFFDFIPSILFGAPEEDSVLSVLPGHKMLLDGRGYEALFLTVMGGLGVMFLTLLSLPALFYFLPLVYGLIKPVIHVLLLAAAFWMVFTEKGKRRLLAVFVFLLAGLFGFITLNSMASDQVLFPAFTGLFGLSTIITSIITKVRIPKQKIQKEINENWLKGSLTGWLAGLLAGMLPGIGASQAGVIAAQTLKAKLKEFLIALGGINTSNIIFTFIVFYLIGKTRSGAAWLISQVVDNFTLFDVCIVIVVISAACFISGILTLKTGRILLEKITSINYAKTMLLVMTSLLILVFLFTGFVGLLICTTGMFTGLFAISAGVKRTHLMGFLLLPTILYFSGLGPAAIVVLW